MPFYSYGANFLSFLFSISSNKIHGGFLNLSFIKLGLLILQKYLKISQIHKLETNEHT